MHHLIDILILAAIVLVIGLVLFRNDDINL